MHINTHKQLETAEGTLKSYSLRYRRERAKVSRAEARWKRRV